LKNNDHISKALVLIGAVFLFLQNVGAQTSYDSLKIKNPKHYFQTVIVLDGYRKPNQDLKDTFDFISNRLKSYGIHQFLFSLSTPIYTSEKSTGDSGVVENWHVLLTANYMNLQPQFAGISTHNLVKAGVGMRAIYNSGKKAVWFFEASPFVTKDASYPSTAAGRLASTIILSINESADFNWRVGITKSFLWGNRLYLPFIGVRYGRLDKVNISVQFPRSISLNLPVSDEVVFSLYTKPQGGMFNFSNRDSVYYLGNDPVFHFTRYEINTGFRADFRFRQWLDFYLAAGVSTKNTITFYSEKNNASKPNLPYKRFFYAETLPSTLFFNGGLVIKFGKTRSYYNNKNIYDAIDLNNTIGGGDDNISNGNFQIPIQSKKKSESNLRSVQDLIDYNDF
jgi:hypothetical protein